MRWTLFARRGGPDEAVGAGADASVSPVEVFPPGSQARVRLSDAGGAHRSFRVFIDDSSPDGMTLRVLTRAVAAASPPPGAELTLLRYAKRQAHAGTVRLLEVREGEPRLLFTTAPAEVSPMPQRSLYRVDVDLRADGAGWTGRVRDLSGSGCLLAFRTEQSIPLGTVLDFALHLPGEEEPLPVTAEVVRASQSVGVAILGLEFVRLTRRQQDTVVRYVFQRQQQLLHDGLLRR